jgi:hypothetical protein
MGVSREVHTRSRSDAFDVATRLTARINTQASSHPSFPTNLTLVYIRKDTVRSVSKVSVPQTPSISGY